jgi:hypothetical protein
MQCGRLEVIDLAHVELDRLLSCTVDELIALVEPMSADNCEQCARAILGRIGGPSFEQLMMRIVETAAPKDGGGPPMNSDTYYSAVRELFPHIAQEDEDRCRGAARFSCPACGYITPRRASKFKHTLNPISCNRLTMRPQHCEMVRSSRTLI